MSISSQQSLSASQSATAAANQLQLLKGCGIFLCSLCCLSVLDVLAKDLVLRNSAPLVNMVRYGVIVCLSLSLMLFKRVPFYVNPSARKWLLLRGCMLGFVGICFMPALQFMPLGEATALYFLSPLIVVLLAPLLLGEKVHVKQYLAVGVGMIGMLLIVNPGGTLSPIGSALMLVAALCYAMVQLLTRKLTGRVMSEQQFFYTAAICAPMGLVVLFMYWPQVWPDTSDILELLLMGLCGGAGQYLLIYAFKATPASILAPINYFQLVLAVIFGQVVFGHMPDLLSFTGIVLIAAAGLSLTLPMLIAYLRRKKI
jgi:drug/metabolite transporter (DMT)-like permease